MKSIFRIPLSEVTSEQLEGIIRERTERGVATTIATLNPEILLRARNDDRFAQTLQSFTLRTIDGFGISLICALKHGEKTSRLTGRAIVDVLFRFAIDKNFKIGLIGGRPGVAQIASDFYSQTYQGANVVDLTRGANVVVDEEGTAITGEHIVTEALASEKPDIILAGFGAPKQERWIEKAVARNATIKVAVGVGGIFDVVSGKLRTPPRVFTSLGLEWFWRLLLQPKRLGRIFNAVIVFTFISLFRD